MNNWQSMTTCPDIGPVWLYEEYWRGRRVRRSDYPFREGSTPLAWMPYIQPAPPTEDELAALEVHDAH